MKLRILSFCSILLFTVIIYSCSSSNHSTADVYELQTGDYSYSLWDASNNVMVEGSITIDAVTEMTVTGTYKTSKINDSTFSAASKLTGGNFSGKFASKTGMLGLNMNPKIADNNVFFSGKVNADKITGTWTENTMTGTKNTGKFEAVKK